MLTLNESTKSSIEKRFGISTEDLSKMDVFDIDAMIEKKINKKLKYDVQGNRSVTARGSVYLFLNRLVLR